MSNGRTKMSPEQVEKFLERWAKQHNLTPAEVAKRLRYIAGARLATVERYAKTQAPEPVKKAPAKKKAAKKAEAQGSSPMGLG
jgi:hypothetical protein